ncbi:MAG TPA: hypothetical protein VE650_15710 [Acetobacteraceae bacterium]|nr:hypothetical protein [Acetobacteraceae bacterium]
MRDVLVDVRCLQGEGYEEALDLLAQARPALPGDVLVGLIDPALPDLPEPALGLLDRLRPNAYTGGLHRPACLVQLAPMARDPLYLARLLLHPAVPCVTRAPRDPAPPRSDAEWLRIAVARHWLAHYDQVLPGCEFWARVAALRPGRAPSTVVGERPLLAVVTAEAGHPLCTALRAFADVEVFAPDRPLATFPWHAPRYDRVVSLVANTEADGRVAALAARYGGAVVVEDCCLQAAYAARPDAARSLAQSELGRALADREMAHWRAGTIRPRVTLCGELAAAAEPLMVYAAGLAREIAARHRREALVLARPIEPSPSGRGQGEGTRKRADAVPSARPPHPDPLPEGEGDGSRVQLRSPGTVLVAHVGGRLAAETCVWALDMLRSWGVHVTLTLCSERFEGLEALCRELALADRVAFGEAAAAADIRLFLAMRGQPSLAGALAAASATGVPCIASRSLVEAFDPPGWVRVIPDEPSPPLLAEAVLEILDRPPPAPAAIGQYRRVHDPAVTAQALCHALGLA